MRILFLTIISLVTLSSQSDEESMTTISAGSVATNATATGVSRVLYQSRDGGQSWQDISEGLPDGKAPEEFFAGQSELYIRLNDIMYRSKSTLSTPVWEKENGPVTRNTSIAFNHSGVLAYNYDGELYKKANPAASWTPIYTNIQKHLMRGVFETSDGTVLLGTDRGLYRSTDSGKTWKHVQNEGWVIDIVESEGVLIATGQNGIMRSADHGEHWEWVISDGGAGIALEVINGGFAAISASSKTISRRIHISRDKGKTWKAIDEGLRPSLSLSSIKQVGSYLFCGHPDGIYRSADLGSTWSLVHSIRENKVVRYGNSWTIVESAAENQVLKLYTSGNVIYAVVIDSGC